MGKHRVLTATEVPPDVIRYHCNDTTGHTSTFAVQSQFI